MIRINDDWVIDVDQYNYILKKDLHIVRTRKNKDGSEAEEHGYKVAGYFSSLSGALRGFGEEIIRDKLKEPSRTLSEAVTAIRECQEEIRRLVELVEDAEGKNDD